MFANVYQGKKVLITGHTGFKGSWLTLWLKELGADVVGLSNEIPTDPSMFEILKLDEQIEHHFVDVRDLAPVKEIVHSSKPDFVFHLAAQPIVSTSYEEPVDTIATNVMGTVNVLEACRELKNPCRVVVITSDKCYRNVEWEWGYRESDTMGGKDIYSGSKGAAELIAYSYFYSFLQNSKVHMTTARAGNVIGGGDWAKDRIVPDCMRSWNKNERVEIRRPESTRPWQHVLEPLSGYLRLAQVMAENPELNGESYNFGPRSLRNYTVRRLLTDLSTVWGHGSVEEACMINPVAAFKEAGLLKLNCDKALMQLDWEPVLSYEDTIQLTGEWYHGFYREDANMLELSRKQIKHYHQEASEKDVVWTREA